MALVTDYKNVMEQVAQFNRDLAADATDATGRRISDRLAMYRAWYYVPEIDSVGPSKFIGYKDTSATDYDPWALDGKETEVVLRKWFRPLEPGTPEEADVRARVEALLARFGKKPNRAVGYCAPYGWKSTGVASQRPAQSGGIGRRTIHATISRGEQLFVAECIHLPIVTQGRTVDETLANLKEAIELHLEGEDLAALGLAAEPVVVVTMELTPWAA